MTAHFDLDSKRVWVAGHAGMVGSAVVRRLRNEPLSDIVVADRTELDLRRQADVEDFIGDHSVDAVVLAAAKVGGIHANESAQGEFLYDNLMIAANVIEACRTHEIGRMAVLGSSCIYPRQAPQPIQEEYLLTGPLEPTNEGYAIAKIAALEMGKMYNRQHGMDIVSLMPTNLYGPYDNFDLETAHVLPALLHKVHVACVNTEPTVEIWGTGAPRREFLHVDDAADAVVFALQHVPGGDSHLNVGVGQDISIRELAELIAETVGWTGEFRYRSDRPDGTPRKLLDVSKLHALGWKARVELREGIDRTYQWLLDSRHEVRGA